MVRSTYIQVIYSSFAYFDKNNNIFRGDCDHIVIEKIDYQTWYFNKITNVDLDFAWCFD